MPVDSMATRVVIDAPLGEPIGWPPTSSMGVWEPPLELLHSADSRFIPGACPT